MREPKYKLNRKDTARWYELLTRHCVECQVKAGRKVCHHRKYLPLSLAERVEFERLCRKRSRKLLRHPRIRESLRIQRGHDRKIKCLLKRFEGLVRKLKNSIDKPR
jgi:hypothetical protein